MKKMIWMLIFMPQFLMAQKTHKVGPKETFYSIGRMYDVHPRELAEYNSLPFEAGLKLDQVIKIPASKKMTPLADAQPNKAPSENTVNTTPAPKKPAATTPAISGNLIYHKVQKKETLYHIKTLYPPVSMEDIRKWNNLESDGLNEGMNLIVGFQKAGETSKKTEPIKKETPTIEAPAKSEPIVAAKPKQAEVSTPVTPVASEPSEKQEKSAPVVKTSNRDFNGGKFKDLYKESDNASNTSGMAASFKSTSGWEDGRYYCLHNSAPAGTIIKITNNANQKVVYAKVLDVIPDLSQNKGLLLRLSNAAADELGVEGERFEVIVKY